MRRFRRRAGGAWLPINPTYIGENLEGKTYWDDSLDWVHGEPPENPDDIERGDGVAACIPLTLDGTIDPDLSTEQESLHDLVQGQDYILNRIVGKVWCAINQNEAQAVIKCIAAFGVAVLPTEGGAAAPSVAGTDWNPLLARNAQEPWLWRRTWILTNQAATTAAGQFPQSSAEYGSVLDGGHIDTKGVKRRITREHRLYMVFAAEALETSFTVEATSRISYGYDVRLNGNMRKARNRSSF